MRVLHLNDYLLQKGGIEVYLVRLMREQEAMGFDVHVGFGKGDGSVWPQSYETIALSIPEKSGDKAGARAVHELVECVQPDVIHLHNIYNAGAVLAAASYRCVLHLHDYRYMCPSSGFYYRKPKAICDRTCSLMCFPLGVLRGCQTPRPGKALGFHGRIQAVRKVADQFEKVVANSQYVADRFRSGISAQARVDVLHYFCPITTPQSVVEAADREPVILFLGRAREQKGVYDFVEVVSRLSSARGVVVGDPTDGVQVELRKRAEQFGCADRLEVSGWMDRAGVSRMMEMASVVIFPSLWAEPFGLVGVEAMAHATPVVGYDVGGVSDWLTDGETGFLVSAGDVSAMAERTQALLDDAALRSKFGQTGRVLVAERFGVGRHVDALAGIYRGGAAL